MRRYPPPSSDSSQELSPEILESRASGMRLIDHEHFEIGLTISPDFYLNYTLTETNVADTVRNGVPEEEIGAWCSGPLSSVFQGEEKEVLFRGYLACLTTA